jgi:hypothetical protein
LWLLLSQRCSLLLLLLHCAAAGRLPLLLVMLLLQHLQQQYLLLPVESTQGPQCWLRCGRARRTLAACGP